MHSYTVLHVCACLQYNMKLNSYKNVDVWDNIANVVGL